MGDNSTDIQDIAQAYLQDYPNVLIENYCIVASSVLLWYDFVLTLPDEYRHMWRRKFTGATAIYLVMRYSAIFDRVFFCLEALVWNSTDQGCVDLTHTDDVFTILNYLAIALFTTMRAYGVWGRDWKPLLVALPLSFLQPVSLVYISAHYTAIQTGQPFACVNVYDLSENILFRTFLVRNIAVLSVAVLLVTFTWIKTFSIVRDSHRIRFPTPVAGMLLRDGTIYFLILIVFLLAPILSPNNIWDDVAPYFGQVFVNIASSRFMLCLRGLYFASGAEDGQTSLRWSDIRFGRGFSSALVGNLGATIDIVSTGAYLSAGDETAPPAPSGCDDEWAEEVPQYFDDPFTMGMKHSDRTDAPVHDAAV